MNIGISELIRFGFLIICAIFIGFLIPLILRATKTLKTINQALTKNEDNINSIVKNVSDTTENIESITSKARDIDQYVDILKVLLSVLSPIINKLKSKEKSKKTKVA